jgi:hypothetical protein
MRLANVDPRENPDRRNPIMPWENEYWTPEPLFAGQTVFCLASGPSLTQEVADQVRGRATIVVNSSYLLAPWASVLFFTDNGWYEKHPDVVAQWPGLVVTVSRRAKRELDNPANNRAEPRILRIKMHGDPTVPHWPPGMPKTLGFPPVGSGLVKQGRNSGNTAVAVAVAMGAKRIALLGYDCQVVNGREHHHDDYTGGRDLTIYATAFQEAFSGWHAAGLASGVEIVNCTHGSAIPEFPFARLEDML